MSTGHDLLAAAVVETGEAAGVIEVGGLPIAYDSRVLEPRPWTAMQSRWAAELLADLEPPASSRDAPAMLELCSGAGHIGLVAAHLAACRWVAVDLDPVACAYARLNAEQAGLGDAVEVRNAPLETAVRPGEKFPVVVADPPWVRSARIGDFPEDPVLAIDGGDDGLDVARAIIRACTAPVPPGGSLLLQLGFDEQVDVLRAELQGGLQGGLADQREVSWSVAEVRHGERGLVARLVRTAA